MGSVGSFLFGGSQQQQGSQNQSSQSSSSQNQSSNSSNQLSASDSVSNQASGSNQYNQAYAPVSAAMNPVLSSTAAAGNMMAALLGLPAQKATAAPAAYAPPSSPLPKTAAPASPNLGNILTQLANAVPKAPAPTSSTPTSSTPTSSTPSTSSYTPPPTTVYPTSGTYYSPSPVGAMNNGGDLSGPLPNSFNNVQYRASGGPVMAGQPYVVGENQPEVFVPHTSGTILPTTAGTGGMLSQLPGSMGSVIGQFQNRFGGNRGSTGGGGIATPGGGVTGSPIPGTPAPTGAPTTTPTVGTGLGTSSNPAASSALSNFANSAGEQFILNQGQQALSGVNAANGVFDSGATGKALVQYGQGLGSTYLNDYLNNLNNYAKLGLSAAGAMTGAGGVGTSQSTGSTSSQSGSVGTSVGQSSGSSTGFGTSSGTSSGSGNSKKGLVPDLIG